MSGTKSQLAQPSKVPSTAMKPLRSMTGYAQAQVSENGVGLRVAVRSVNHRFLDLHLRVPEGLEPLEPRIRQIVRERVRRGHLDVTLRYEVAGPAAVTVNQEVAAAYLRSIEELRKQFGVKTEPDMASVLRLPGVIGSTAASPDEEILRLESVIARCLIEALDKLDQMREREASALRDDMAVRLTSMASQAARVETLAERARPAFARRLELRLKDLLGDSLVDPARLAQEAALAAQR